MGTDDAHAINSQPGCPPWPWWRVSGGGRGLTQGVAAGQAAVQGLGVDVQGSVELLAVPLTAPLQVVQEVTES